MTVLALVSWMWRRKPRLEWPRQPRPTRAGRVGSRAWARRGARPVLVRVGSRRRILRLRRSHRPWSHHRPGPKPALHVRTWTCDACGVSHERVAEHPGHGVRGQGRVRSPAIACGGGVGPAGPGSDRSPGETGTCGVSRKNPHPSRARRLCQLMQSRPDNSLATVTFALASALARSVLAAAVARNVLADLMRGRD